jgi:hypothetical protein
MVKFVINCTLNIQTQHKFKYAIFFLQWWGRGRGPVGQMSHQSMVLKNALMIYFSSSVMIVLKNIVMAVLISSIYEAL